MSRKSVPAVLIAAILQCLPYTAFGVTDTRGEDLPRAGTIGVSQKISHEDLVRESGNKVIHHQIRKEAAASPESESLEEEDESPVADSSEEATPEEDERSWLTSFLTTNFDELKQLIRDRNTVKPKAPDTASARDDDSEVLLDLKGAQKAFGSKFGLIQKDGKFYLKGVTTRDCVEKIGAKIEGTDISLKVPKSCAELPQDLTETVDLSREAPLPLAMPKDSATICLLTENVYESGEDRRHCDPLLKIVSAKDAAAEKARLIREKNAEIAEELRSLVADCGGSNSLSDKLAAYEAVKLSKMVLGTEEANETLNELRDGIAQKSLVSAAAERISAHEKLEQGVIPVLLEGTEEQQLKVVEFRKKMWLSRVFNSPEKTLAERKEIYEEGLDALSDLDLNVDEEKREAIIKTYKEVAGKKFAEMEKTEKVNEARAEIPGAQEAARRSLLAQNPMEHQQAMAAYAAVLQKHFQALGCNAAQTAGSKECGELRTLFNDTRNMHAARNQYTAAVAACNSEQAKSQLPGGSPAKCEQLQQFQAQWQAGVLGGAANSQQQTLNVGAPPLTLPNSGLSNAAQPTGIFDTSKQTGSNTTFTQYQQYSQQAAQNNVFSPQNTQTPAVTRQPTQAVQPAPAAPVQTRRLGTRR